MKWTEQSNRDKHVWAGGMIFSGMLILCIILGVRDWRSLVIADATTFIAAVTADYKDKLWGGLFDWLDVISTMLIPFVMTITLGLILILLR